MKLRNKKTGEIGELTYFNSHMYILVDNELKTNLYYNSLAELNEEWEDYEEPKEFFAISPYKKEGYEVFPYDNFGHIYKLAEELGIAFKTKEEAEKAVEKLKAWKRLKDKGFKVIEWTAGLGDDNYKIGEVMVGFDIDGVYDGNVPDDTEKDLDLLFEGEE